MTLNDLEKYFLPGFYAARNNEYSLLYETKIAVSSSKEQFQI